MAFRVSLLITGCNSCVQGPCYLNELKFKINFMAFLFHKRKFCKFDYIFIL